jgi:hypothetical protein
MISAFSGVFSLQRRSAVPSGMGGGEFQFKIGEGAEVMFAANADTGCRLPVRVQAVSTGAGCQYESVTATWSTSVW